MGLYDNNIFNPIQPNSLYPYSPPASNFIQQPVQQPIKVEIIKVNGQRGAESMSLAPNSSILLLDMKDPIIWFVSTDGAGYKTCIPYDISPHKQVTEQNIEGLLSRINSRLDALEGRINVDESNSTAIKPTAKQRAEWDI